VIPRTFPACRGRWFAASIACTEDQVAATLERMALAWPEDAMRLQAQMEEVYRD
jgi:hypothetical protein